MITEDEFKQSLPRQLRNRVNQEVMDTVNEALNDPHASEQIRENIIGYNHVMQEGKFSIPEYINAVRYVSYKVMGCSNIESYTKTFPTKYAKFKFLGTDDKTIARYVTAYNKTKLVNLIFEQSLIPTYILNADMHQKALNVQAELMMNAKSEKVRSDAANSLLTHLKAPETKKVELDINMKEDKTIQDLRASTMELVKQQRAMIDSGSASAKDIAHSELVIDVTAEEV